MNRKAFAAFLLALVMIAVLCGCNGDPKTCDHCGENVEWKQWNKADALPTQSGHWILSKNVTLNGQQEIAEGQNVVLDLAGMTVANSVADRIYHVNAADSALTLMDSKKSGKLVVTGEMAIEGGGIMVTAGEFDLYDAVLDASGSKNQRNGGAVSVAEGATFHMHSGTIIGATLTSEQNEEGNVFGGSGGSVAVAGTMVMDSGVIRDGCAMAFEQIEVKDDVATVKGVYNGYGGNLYGTGEASIDINGGEILNGRAGVSGGNIYIDGFCVVRMHNGVISGGKTTLMSPGGQKTNANNGGGGGNVFVNITSDFWMDNGEVIAGETNGFGGNIRCEGVLNVKNGKISGGVCYDTANVEYDAKHKNVFLYRGNLSMDGGEIAGYVEVSDYYDSVCSVRVAGTAKINGGAECTSNLDLGHGVRVTVAEMKPGADVRMRVQNGAFTNKTTEANMKYITLENENAEIKSYDGVYYINGRVNCICGLNEKGEHFGDCDGSQKIWAEWTDTEMLPTSDGYYYLANDIDMKDTAVIRGEKKIFVDFNGKTANNKNKLGWRIYSLFDTTKKITLTLTDTSEKKNGGLKAYGKLTDQGMTVWCRSTGHSMVLYGGILDASETTSRKDGSALCGHGGTSITIHGGTVIGGNNIRYDYKNADGTTSMLGGCGGTVCAEGYFRMTGGVICNGKATGKQRPAGMDTGNGGNLYVGPKAEAVIEGGSIYGGKAYRGGNICSWGKLTISGGKIYGGTATGAGANIFLYNVTSAKISDKCVDGGIEENSAS